MPSSPRQKPSTSRPAKRARAHPGRPRPRTDPAARAKPTRPAAKPARRPTKAGSTKGGSTKGGSTKGGSTKGGSTKGGSTKPAQRTGGAASPSPPSLAVSLPGGRHHVLSLSFVRDGDEFLGRIETDSGHITELKNRSLDLLLTLVASELEDLLE